MKAWDNFFGCLFGLVVMVVAEDFTAGLIVIGMGWIWAVSVAWCCQGGAE